MRGSTKLLRAWSVAIPLSWLMLSGTWAQQSAVPKRVLVLYWYNRDYPGDLEFERCFQAALRSAGHGKVEYYAEYLDADKFPGDNQPLVLRDYLRQKYADRTIDVIVTNTPVALDFFLKFRSYLFPGAPIVFATVDTPDAERIAPWPGATGIVYAKTHRKTLDLALRLHPDTEHVFVVSGNKSFEETAKNELAGFESKAAVTYLTGLPIEDLVLRIRHLPERSVILYVRQQLRNRQGTVLDTQSLLAMLANSARVPIYGMSFTNIGRGVVGGYVWTIEGNATKLAELTLRIVKGEAAANIPVEKAPDVPMFAWRQLLRWNIGEDQLPPGSIIRFRELTAWQQYRWHIIAGIATLALQTLLIGALLLERRRVRRSTAALQKTQRVLQESEERFRVMADTAPVMIWVAGPDQHCTFFNKGWLNFTGQLMEQELGFGSLASIHPDDAARCTAIYSASFEARRPFQMEHRLRRVDGEYRSVICSGVPRFERDGTFTGFIGTCLDITELERTQEKALAGQKLESMGLMANGIAHDFNNLLGGIMAWAELALAEHSEGNPDFEELMRIKAAAMGGAEIVREMMTYGGKTSEAFEAIDCSQITQEILQLLKISISKYAILKLELAEGLPLVRGSPAQLRQLIMNLVINASEAIGERPGEIRVTTRLLRGGHDCPALVPANLPLGNYVQLEVADTGPGMPEDARARIFDAFFTTKPAGRGLGLAVVQGVVRAHKGAIHVSSESGRGTAFQVFLPCIAKPLLETRNGTRSGTTGESLPITGTVLMIEDEETLRLAVAKMLRKRGFSVIEAADGNAGVDLFAAKVEEIGVVLLDMTLPGKSGREVLRELRRLQAHVKVIITSAYGQDRVQQSLVGVQLQGYLQKPYQLTELIDLLRNALRQDGDGAARQRGDSMCSVAESS